MFLLTLMPFVGICLRTTGIPQRVSLSVRNKMGDVAGVNVDK